MIVLNARALLSDKLPDVANVAVGALFFGQFLSERAFSTAVAICGAAAWLFLIAIAVKLAGEKEQ